MYERLDGSRTGRLEVGWAALWIRGRSGRERGGARSPWLFSLGAAEMPHCSGTSPQKKRGWGPLRAASIRVIRKARIRPMLEHGAPRDEAPVMSVLTPHTGGTFVDDLAPSGWAGARGGSAVGWKTGGPDRPGRIRATGARRRLPARTNPA